MSKHDHHSSLADEFAEKIYSEQRLPVLNREVWLINNRHRILAALEMAYKALEDVRIAGIVRAPTDEQAFEIDTAVDGAASVENGSRACAAILALANEACERERQG